MRRPLATFLLGAALVSAGYPILAPRAVPPAAASPASGDDAAALVAKGAALLEKGDYPGAQDAFVAAVGKDPKSLEARRGAAEALLGLGFAQEGIDQAYKGLDLSSNEDAGLWLLAARGFLLKGDQAPPGDENIPLNYADAAAKAAQAIRLEPALIEGHIVLARANRMMNRTPDALEALAAALRLDPENFDALFEQGMVFVKATDYGAAVEAFDRAAAADPKSAQARFRKGFALCYMRQWDLAYDEFVRAAVLDPADHQPLQYLAKYAGKRSPEFFRLILKDAPDHAWAHAYLAYYLAYEKKGDEALKESRAALALAPKDAGLTAWHGQILDILGKRQEAVGAWVKALQADPGADIAWNKLLEFATAPASGAKADERKEVIRVLAAARPTDALLWNNVGLLNRDILKDYRVALDAYLKAAEYAPTDQGIVNDTGLMYLYHGQAMKEDRKKSLPYFERTLALVEDDGQNPEMGYRDALENLAVYFMEVEKDPARALPYAEKRNDPDLLGRLPQGIGAPSPRANGVAAWARKELGK